MFMESFEAVLIQYEPLIKGMIKRFSYVESYDELFQVGRIALWEAYMNFDPDKGYFPAYARSYLYGRFMQLCKKDTFERVEATEAFLTNKLQYEETYLDSFILEEYIKDLSKRERMFVEFVILHRGKQKELAKREGVSYETVRSWRKSALAKLRIKGAAMNNI
jgi:RNA polymerase sigma factor (sigma-70 family)